MSLPYWPEDWPVTLQFVTSNDIQDRVIQYVTHGWTSHCDVVWPPNVPGGKERLFGARLDGGVAVRSADYKQFTKVARVTLPMNDDQRAIFFKFCKDQMGKPYDWPDILNFVFPFIRRDWRDDNSKWFCSELTEAAIENTGFWKPVSTSLDLFTPVMQFALCSTVAQVVYV